MKSLKARLLMVITVLAVVLAASVPAIAEDSWGDCEAPEGAKVICKETVITTTSNGSSEDDPGLQDATEDPFASETDTAGDPSDSGIDTTTSEDPSASGTDTAAPADPFSADCYPFCGVDWPW